jgi:hypothetical protein
MLPLLLQLGHSSTRRIPSLLLCSLSLFLSIMSSHSLPVTAAPDSGCAAGSYFSLTTLSCQLCPAGSYCAGGSWPPTACPVHSWSVMGASQCTCYGGYQSHTGYATALSPCYACSSGRYSSASNASTSCSSCGTGAWSQPASIDCDCLPSFYHIPTGRVTSQDCDMCVAWPGSYCDSRISAHTSPCPRGFMCLGLTMQPINCTWLNGVLPGKWCPGQTETDMSRHHGLLPVLSASAHPFSLVLFAQGGSSGPVPCPAGSSCGGGDLPAEQCVTEPGYWCPEGHNPSLLWNAPWFSKEPMRLPAILTALPYCVYV